jgi:hypothetical protein
MNKTLLICVLATLISTAVVPDPFADLKTIYENDKNNPCLRSSGLSELEAKVAAVKNVIFIRTKMI